nr:MAG TPA: hypothetical protein [Caudoviricetes sp.]
MPYVFTAKSFCYGFGQRHNGIGYIDTVRFFVLLLVPVLRNHPQQGREGKFIPKQGINRTQSKSVPTYANALSETKKLITSSRVKILLNVTTAFGTLSPAFSTIQKESVKSAVSFGCSRHAFLAISRMYFLFLARLRFSTSAHFARNCSSVSPPSRTTGGISSAGSLSTFIRAEKVSIFSTRAKVAGSSCSFGRSKMNFAILSSLCGGNILIDVELHGALRHIVDGSMSLKLHSNLAFPVFGGLQGEASGRQHVFQANSRHSLVSHVSNPPDCVGKIGQFQGVLRGNLVPAYSGGADSQFHPVGSHGHGGKAHLAFPTVQLFQLLGVVGDIVDILSVIGISSHTASLDTAGGRKKDICILRFCGLVRVKIAQDHASPTGDAFESVSRNLCKHLCQSRFPPYVKYSAVIFRTRRLMVFSSSGTARIKGEPRKSQI